MSSVNNNNTCGLALGVFDFCHQGHINLIKRCRESCSFFVTGLHSDDFTFKYKNVYPANSELERKAAIEDLGLADVVCGGG